MDKDTLVLPESISMKYFISFKNPLTHFFTVHFELEAIKEEQIQLELPIWRPGRYEAANFAKNIRGFKVYDKQGKPIEYIKSGPNIWKINTTNVDHLVVIYDYWAFKMDAGNSWYDEEQIYINFINCLIYDPEQMERECSVNLDLPDNYQIACGLKRHGQTFLAKDYYELVDSPLMSGPKLECLSYSVNDFNFHIWLNDTYSLDQEKLVDGFKKFTKIQIKEMGDFPESEYHFLLHILPYPFYHGVEHHDSTVICLGPGKALATDSAYSQLLGISSHELFHAWNIIKIRPKEMMPYKFNKEVFFPTGFVAEGFTTYYGDLFLVRGDTFDKAWYFIELNKLFKRHFSNYGRLNYSVVDSSLDLWIDGYSNTTPDRKSSIYVEGAMIALCLDLMIRKNTENKRSLDDVMRVLWKEYGKNEIGYQYDDIIRIAEDVYGGSLNTFFLDHVKGTEPKEQLIDGLLKHVGCTLIKVEPNNVLENYFGIKIASIPNGGENRIKIVQIVPGSIGEQHFSLNDELLTINERPLEIKNIDQFDLDEVYLFKVRRNFDREIEINLHPTDQRYFTQYKIEPVSLPTDMQQISFKKWTGQVL